MIKTSIIMPIYNPDEKLLKEALNSALSQTLSDIELIAIDDGSDDNSYFDLMEYVKKSDKRLKFYKKSHEFSGITRNIGISISKGETIMFLDCDDYYPDNTVLETFYTILKTKNVLVSGGKHKVLTSNGTIKTPYFNYGDINVFFANKIINFFDYQFPFWYWCFMYDANMLRQNKLFFPNFKRYQDPLWFVKTMHVAKRFFASDIISYTHREMSHLTNFDKVSLFSHVRGISQLLKYSDKAGYNKMHNLLYQLFCDFDTKLFENVADLTQSEKKALIEKIKKSTNKLILEENLQVL